MKKTDHIHPEKLCAHVMAFAGAVARALENMVGRDCRIMEEAFGVEPERLPHRMHATMAFHGVVQGELLLSMAETTAAKLIGMEEGAPPEELAAGAGKWESLAGEVFAASVGAALESLIGEFGELVLLPPKVIYGEIHYPNATMALATARIEPGGYPVECRVILNLTRVTPGQHLQMTNDALQIREREIRQARESLDHMMTVLPGLNKAVDDLFILQNVIRQSTARSSETGGFQRHYFTQFSDITQKIRRLLTRMWSMPLRKTFEKATFLATRFSHDFKKQVQIHLDDEGVEIDRQTDDILSKLLEMLIRNAVEYGIESPELRLERGKTEFGNLYLKGRAESGYILIEAADDGGGLNRNRLLVLAEHAGMLEGGAEPSDHEVNQLIFWSSPDERIHGSLHGVKKMLRQIGGHIVVRSEPQRGSRFFIRFPMAMSTTDGIIVSVGTQEFIIPVMNVRETLRPQRTDCLTVMGKGEVIRLRNQLIPLIRLDKLWGADAGEAAPEKTPGKAPWDALVVVAEIAGEYRCILVDQVIGKQSFVIQSLGEHHWLHSDAVIGGSIMSDGKVGLVLDVKNLFSQASRLS